MRRNDLDYARGIAILLVIIGHANGLDPLSLKIIYSVHVPLFFVISGMLLVFGNTVQKSWKQILRGWLRRIIVPSVIWECVLSVFYYFIKKIPIPQLLNNTLTLNFNLSVLWFVLCLLAAETIWITLAKMAKGNYLSVCTATAIVFAAAAQFVDMTFIKRVLIAFTFLSIGCGFEHLRIRKNVVRILYSCGTIVALLLVWAITAALNIRVDLSYGVLGNPLLYYIHSAAGSLAIILLCRKIRLQIPFLNWIGQNTFGLLVTHVFVRHAIIAVEESFCGQFFGGWALALPMVFISAVAVCALGLIAPEIIGQKRKDSREKT